MERGFTIERAEGATFIESLPLQSRRYRAKKKETDTGRLYSIRGLYNFCRTPEIACKFTDNIEKDLQNLEELMTSKKR